MSSTMLVFYVVKGALTNYLHLHLRLLLLLTYIPRLDAGTKTSVMNC